MNTFQLTCFLTVAETLSFAKAAKLLNVTQPAVTHQIHSLEEELNAQLFKRTTRSVEITQEGLLFMNDAKNVLNIITLAKKRFEEPVVDERQFFSIDCHSHNELHLLPEILRQMADSCPMLYPVFQVVPFQHLYQLLDEETVDVIIAFQEKSAKKIDGVYKELAQVRITGVLPADHPLAKEELLDEDDLRTQRLLLLADAISFSRGVVLKAAAIFCLPVLLGGDTIWLAPLAAEMLTLLPAQLLFKTSNLTGRKIDKINL